MRQRRSLRLGAITAIMSLVAVLLGVAPQANAATAAAQPGVTATTITVGNVVILTGPVPGLFAGALNGVKAYFNYINSKGGVNGRMLEIKSGDDGYSCANNAAVTAADIPDVFAFVGNFSVFDACGAPALVKSPLTADISLPLDPQLKEVPNVYSPSPSPSGYRYGPLLYMKKLYPAATQKVGSIYGDTALVDWQQQEGALKTAGYKVVYQASDTATTTQFQSYIIRMKSEGVQFLLTTDMDVEQQADLYNQMAQQGWKPKVILLESAYDPNFFKLLTPGAVNGAWFDQTFALFLGQDSAAVPEVKLFNTWVAKTTPGFTPDLYTMYSWAAAALFVKVLRTLGSNPTQAGLIAGLKKTGAFTDNGMLAPGNIGKKTPPTCYVIGRVVNNQWVRLHPAKSGFMCQPGGYWYQPASAAG